MRKMYVVLMSVVLLAVLFSQISGATTTQSLVMQNMNSVPLAFTENQGQWDDRVKFRADAGGAAMWFTEDGVYYQFTRRIPKDGPSLDGPLHMPHDRFSHEPDSIEQLVIKASFVGANLNPEIVGDNMMEYKCNYFIGNNPDEWHTDVPNYEAVVFKDVYAGIDLKYYGNGQQMEYDFIVSPGADPSQIMVQYDGAKSISVNDNGELVVETEWGDVTELRPLIYQFDANGCMPIDGWYVLFTDNTFGFDLGDRYDPTIALVIDPVLTYSTYLGGYWTDCGTGIAIDSSGCIYVSGYTSSSDFPITSGSYDTTLNGTELPVDVFVAKLIPSGTELIYSTYIGGTEIDVAIGFDIDSYGNAHVVGETHSEDFPVVNAYQGDYLGLNDNFVIKLNGDGNQLIYSTYLGSEEQEDTAFVAVGPDDYAYVCGSTRYSSLFPGFAPLPGFVGGRSSIYVAKFTPQGDSLVYGGFIGGSLDESPAGICVDSASCAYVTGVTSSSNFSVTPDAFQTSSGGYNDAFICRISPAGDSLVFSSYLGGSYLDDVNGIALDQNGVAYVTGQTLSEDFPAVNPLMPQRADDMFISSIAPDGDSLLFSTCYGGADSDRGYAIACDDLGYIYVSGYTSSADFPILNPIQGALPFDEATACMLKISADGDSVVYSSFLAPVSVVDIEPLGEHNLLLVGSGGEEFPLVTPFQSEYGGQGDAIIARVTGYICGDANASGAVDIDDVAYLITYIFSGGPEPVPYESGDANCSGGVDIDDVVYLIAYIFSGGYAPCDPDGDGVPDC